MLDFDVFTRNYPPTNLLTLHCYGVHNTVSELVKRLVVAFFFRSLRRIGVKWKRCHHLCACIWVFLQYGLLLAYVFLYYYTFFLGSITQFQLSFFKSLNRCSVACVIHTSQSVSTDVNELHRFYLKYFCTFDFLKKNKTYFRQQNLYFACSSLSPIIGINIFLETVLHHNFQKYKSYVFPD